MIDNKLLLDGMAKPDIGKSSSLWNSKFPDEPFHADYTKAELKYTPQSTYNLYEATQRQAKFYYNVSLPHYENDKFLKTALERYRKFLYLRYVSKQLYFINVKPGICRHPRALANHPLH